MNGTCKFERYKLHKSDHMGRSVNFENLLGHHVLVRESRQSRNGRGEIGQGVTNGTWGLGCKLSI